MPEKVVPNEPVVSLQKMRMVYGDLVAVNDIDFNVNPGEVRGILGGNGAGKSTTMKILGGVMKPTAGKVTVAGYDVTTYKGGNDVRSVLGYCPDVGGLISGATPIDHVRLLATLHRNKKLYTKGLEEIKRFGLHQFRDTPTSGFSHGMSRRLSVMLASLTAQKLFVVDEPLDGVDPLGITTIFEVINEIRESGAAVIISTHLQDLLTEVSDTVSIMKSGKVLDTLDKEFLSGPEGIAAYRRYLVENREYTSDEVVKGVSVNEVDENV